MKVVLKLFAVARQFAGTGTLELELNSGATVSQLRVAFVEKCPEMAGLEHGLRFAVNSDYAADDTVLREGDEVACIPPVSGG